jgi:hypothetical protein
MRLLKVDTLELHEYFEAQIPPYAILSHHWEDGGLSTAITVWRRSENARILEDTQLLRSGCKGWVGLCCRYFLRWLSLAVL